TDADLTITTPGAPPSATNDAPTGGVQVEYGNAVTPTVTITGLDANTPGSGLTATAIGFPPGLSLAISSTSPGNALPGRRTWSIDGQTTAVPGIYQVKVRITDSTGRTGSTTFPIEVTSPQAQATSTGDTVAAAGGAAPIVPGALTVQGTP